MGAVGGAVGGAVAAAHAERGERVTDAFRLADATKPDRARTLAELKIEDLHREVRDMTGDGVLLPGARAGSWYLSEAAFVAHREAESRKTVRVILILAALGVAIGVVAAVLHARNR